MEKKKHISLPKLQKGKIIPISASKSLNSKVIQEGYKPDKNGNPSKNESKLLERSEKEIMMDLANKIKLFHSEDKVAYAVIPKKGHVEVWPVESSTFESFLTYQYLEITKSAPSQYNLKEVINTMKALAIHKGECQAVARRVAYHEGHILLDLCDDQWRVIDIGPEGWTVRKRSPIPFIRTAGMKPLPLPITGGSVEKLRPFINVSSDSGFRLAVAWLLAAFRPGYPFPILILQGEQGSGKSTTAKILRSLIDPSQEEATSAPKTERDLMIHASNSWVVSFDNLSGIPTWFSDALCRVATGGGFKTRKLYTDYDEIILKVQRPIILNGIDEVAARGDLLDRSVGIELASFSSSGNDIKTEQEFWGEFEEAKPRIFGALLDVVSSALSRIGYIRPNMQTRMLDFVYWISAAEQALGWPEGQFIKDYEANKKEAVTGSLSEDTLAQGVLRIASVRGSWQGSTAELREVLRNHLSATEFQSLRAPNWIGRRLTRLKPSLRNSGVYVERRRTSSGNVWVIRSVDASTGSTAFTDGSTDNP